MLYNIPYRTGVNLANDTLLRLAELWTDLVDIVQLLFAEPSPAPIKHWLWRLHLIPSPELRLPMTQVTATLAGQIDRMIQKRAPPASVAV